MAGVSRRLAFLMSLATVLFAALVWEIWRQYAAGIPFGLSSGGFTIALTVLVGAGWLVVFLAIQLGFYPQLRDFLHRTTNPDEWARRMRLEEFTGRFVKAGDLVFDVGANQGRWTEVYQRLGARVVAVEPNPKLARLVKQRYRPFAVVASAMGSEPGTAKLHLGKHSGHSTLSDEWMRVSREAEPGPDRWQGTVDVPVERLDDLIQRYGTPDVVKIDVEGFEDAALRGLSVGVPLLYLEFHCIQLEATEASVAILERLGAYEYNYSVGQQQSWRLDDWVSSRDLFAELRRLAKGAPNSYGDIFARRVDAVAA